MTQDEWDTILDSMEEFVDLVWHSYPQSRRALMMGSLQYAGLGDIPPEELDEYRRQQRELWG